MKARHPKPRPLFSCGFFRHCTQTVLSPTATHSPSLPLTSSAPPPTSPPPPPPPPPPLSLTPLPSNPHPESSSSSSSTSQSFTQWKFHLPTSPLHSHSHTPHTSEPQSRPAPKSEHTVPGDPSPSPSPLPIPFTNVHEVFHVAELQLSSGSDSDQLFALHFLERSLLPNPLSGPVCPPKLMLGVVRNLRNKAGAKPATKVLLALCLAECNRLAAVEAGAVGAVVETAMELEAASAERALAALELMCTVGEGAAEVRAHALSVPVMVTMMGKMGGRGRESAISVLAVVYGEDGRAEETAVTAPPEEVARAVVLALQGESTQRGRRKGAHLLKVLEEYGRRDLTENGNMI